MSEYDKRGHLPRVDALRGIAILGVLAFHCLGITYGKIDGLSPTSLWRESAGDGHVSFFLVFPLSFGWVGVSLFFVISGFVIHHSFLRAKQFSVTNFYWRRFWRIYPPYLLALSVFALQEIRNAGLTPFVQKSILLHLMMAHNFSLPVFYDINPSFWSLAPEMQFYLLYPIVLMFRKRFGFNAVLRGMFGIWLIMTMIGLVYWRDKNTIIYFGNPCISFSYWLLGAYVAEKFHRKQRALMWPTAINWLIALVMLTCAFSATASLFLWPLAAILCASVVERVLWMKKTFFAERLFITLGICSYSFYLWHQPLLDHINIHTRLYLIHHTWLHFVALFFTSLAIVFPISYGLYYTVERLAQRIAHKSGHRAITPGNTATRIQQCADDIA